MDDDNMQLPGAIQFAPGVPMMVEGGSQPDMVRLLAISCLGRAIHSPPWFGDQSSSDLCETIAAVTKNIDLITSSGNFHRLVQHACAEFGGENGHLMRGLTWTDGRLRVRRNAADVEVTPSHIKGEAYEILCAIVFQCKKKTPIIIKDYYGELPEDGKGVQCTVKNVFLSEAKFEKGSDFLRWCDNADALEGFKGRIKNHLVRKGADESLVDKFLDKLQKNIDGDLGFDLLIELEQVDQGSMHLILAQCKYRSNQFVEVPMADYVGKYYGLVHLLDKINHSIHSRDNTTPLVLCPFFWMTTQLRQDTMNYFSSLCSYGRIKFYGNTAMRDDQTVCNLISNIKGELQCWNARIISNTTQQHEFEFTSQRKPHKYQISAIDKVAEYCTEEKLESAGTPIYASVIMATGSGKTLTSFLSVKNLEDLYLTKKIESENIAASLHLSPMIRLVMQNAHEWLAEELARKQDKMDMIYYCVCSLKKERNKIALSGCTAVQLINSDKLFSVFQHHRDNKTIHRCRFFTTYHAGKALMRTMRDINLKLYKRNPIAQLFGVTVRDEGHTAVGRGSKSHSASLYLPAYVGLNFTASPKYEHGNIMELFPPDEKSENQKATYLSIPNNRIFPQVDLKYLENLSSEQEMQLSDYTRKQWSPIDFLSEDMLFHLIEEGKQYDWSYFQRKANESKTGIVIFHVKDDAIVHRDDNDMPCYDISMDRDGNPEYFGVVANSTAEQRVHLQLHHDSECYGVNKSGDKLFKPRKNRRGFTIHDMAGLGASNRIGPVIHKLSYYDCMNTHICLVKPRLIMLKRKNIDKSKYQNFNIEDTEYLDRIFGKVWTKVKGEYQPMVKSPQEVPWRLTICGNIIDGNAHAFRSMKLLLECFMLTENRKPIKTALVFCSKTEESKMCKNIFDALLRKSGCFCEPGEFFTGIIYTSDASAQDDDDAVMSYEIQQETLADFCQAPRGVLFNVKLVGIGVDLPSIDAALIVNPVASPSDVTQKVGRALRKNKMNIDKIATVIVPSWDFSDLVSYNDHPEMSTPAMSTITEAPSTLHEYPSTPLPKSTDAPISVDTPVGSAPAEPNTWSPPVRNSFEEKFWLQVRVLKAMMDQSIDMITSVFNGSLEINSSGKHKSDGPQSVEALMKEILADSREKPHVPVYDESFSEFLLDAWDFAEIENLNAQPRPPRDGVEELRKSRHEKKSKIFLLVACCACCHHYHIHGDYQFGKSKKTFLWASSVKPFEERIPMDEIRKNNDSINWEIVDLETVDHFEEAAKKAGGMTHNTSNDFRDSFRKVDEGEREKMIESFLDFLTNDILLDSPTIMQFMNILCDSLKQVFPGNQKTCERSTHNLEGFGFNNIDKFKEKFRAFLGEDWMTTTRKPARRTQSRSTGTKRTLGFDVDEDEDDAIISPMSQPDECIHRESVVREVRRNKRDSPYAAGQQNSAAKKLDMDTACTSSAPQ